MIIPAVIHAHFPEFEHHQILVGDQVRWENNTPERGLQAFSQTTLKSHKDLEDWIMEETIESNAKRAYLRNNGFNFYEMFDNYVPVQFNTDIDVSGNNYHLLGNSAKSAQPRRAKSGDVFWIKVNDDGSINKALSIRADCGNGGFTSILPSDSKNNKSISSPYSPTGNLGNIGRNFGLLGGESVPKFNTRGIILGGGRLPKVSNASSGSNFPNLVVANLPRTRINNNNGGNNDGNNSNNNDGNNNGDNIIPPSVMPPNNNEIGNDGNGNDSPNLDFPIVDLPEITPLPIPEPKQVNEPSMIVGVLLMLIKFIKGKQ